MFIINKIKKIISNFIFKDFIKNLFITIKYLFSKKITIKFPEKNIPISIRFRGLHALRKYNNKKERCIACKLCESICPAMAIKIKLKKKYNKNRTTSIYNINLLKCIFCGLCEESCPVNSIVETQIFKYYGNKKKDLLLNKKKLLYIGEKYKNIIKLNLKLNFKY